MQSVETSAPVLQDTLAQLCTATSGYLRARAGAMPESDWITASEILAHSDRHFPALLDSMAGSLNAGERKKVVASFFLKEWLRQIVLASVGCYLLQKRVPDVSIGNLAMRFTDGGRVDEIAFLQDRLVVLQDDHVAGMAGVHTVTSLDELRSALRDTLAWSHVEPLIGALRACVPVGDRFMWATTADTCVGFILLLDKWLKQDGAFRYEADQLASMEPLSGKTGCIDVTHDGQVETVLQRGCCCFAYHLDQYERCKTCPLLPPETRIENIRAEMAARRE